MIPISRTWKKTLIWKKMIKFADLFAGMGGMGLGWEMACRHRGISTERVCTAEIKPHAVTALKSNISPSVEALDITGLDRIEADVFLAGFPCQAFSVAGMHRGFEDERGGMFFHLARLIEASRPRAFLLENVEGLLSHNHGKTMQTVTDTLKGMGYHTAYSVVDCSRAGVPQNRKRVFIVGSLQSEPDMWTPFSRISPQRWATFWKRVCRQWTRPLSESWCHRLPLSRLCMENA